MVERKCQDRIKKELSICHFLLCLDLVSFPVLNQIKPQAPLLVVPSVISLKFQLATALLPEPNSFDFT